MEELQKAVEQAMKGKEADGAIKEFEEQMMLQQQQANQ